MADSITTRISRLIAGGAHALLDRAEDLAPEASMMQSIREIEQVADEVRADLGRAEAGKHLALSQMARLNAEHETLSAQIDAALANGREDLARTAIGRQADIEDLLPVLQKNFDEQSDQAKELESYVVALLAKKRELEQLLADYHARLGRAPSAADVAETHDDGYGRQMRADGAAASFGRVLARQTGATGLTSGLVGDAGRLKEIAELQREHRISERLATIKAAKALPDASVPD